jgi:hydrogenase maturation protease
VSHPRILIAGIGNIFFGDDAFGVEVARRLGSRALPGEVRVKDFGIRGYDLACALTDDYFAAILVDAMPRGGAPGTLYVIDPDGTCDPRPDHAPWPIDNHRLDPMSVLRLVPTLGPRVGRLLIVGCEPSPPSPSPSSSPSPSAADGDEMQMEMSQVVRAAVDGAVALIESLVAGILAEGGE